jgi:T-complex protein 1 subunit gamma
VSHPAAKSVIDLSRCQDEEVGDGTTSVVILTGELLTFTEPLLKKQIHPTQIVSGFLKVGEKEKTILIFLNGNVQTLDDCLEIMEASATTVDLSNTEQIRTVIESCMLNLVSFQMHPYPTLKA